VSCPSIGPWPKAGAFPAPERLQRGRGLHQRARIRPVFAGGCLGGGFGRQARRFGPTLDDLKSVDIVTADGRLLQASAEENPELFRGVRGAGGSFCVVTSFEFGEGNIGRLTQVKNKYDPTNLFRLNANVKPTV